MKASELIKAIQEQIELYGDCECLKFEDGFGYGDIESVGYEKETLIQNIKNVIVI